MRIELLNPISTDVSQRGDRFEARVVEPAQFADAVVTGRVTSVRRPGKLKGAGELQLSFEQIRLTDGRAASFGAQVTQVVTSRTDTDTGEVDPEGGVHGRSTTKDDVTKVGAATGVGAIIGAIADGGKGAAIGAAVGAGAGLGSVYAQGRDDLTLPRGTEIAVRTTALLGSFLVASAVLARIGAASLGAHQIAFQLFVFLALVLDAIAIAGQVMVGRMLGAGDAGGARAAATRMIGWSVAAGTGFGVVLLALGGVLPRAFTDDAAVVERAHEIWPLFAAMMPANGAVFALDGILIGAGDTRFLAVEMLASAVVAIPVAVGALEAGWGIAGVWGALCAFIAVRLVACAARFSSGRWAVTGATV
jgi:hypothetical protein